MVMVAVVSEEDCVDENPKRGQNSGRLFNDSMIH